MPHKARWGCVIGGLAAYDIWAAFNKIPGDSLSEVVRDVWRTQTPEGRAAFVASWALLTAWFVPHIINEVKESSWLD